MKKKIFIFLVFFIALIFGMNLRNYSEKYIESGGQAEKSKNTSWIVTQYGEKNMPQMMCFTIEGNEEGLVVIDGGYKNSEEDVNRIVEIASKHNNEIDAWIVTHLDSDHVGVCLNIIDYHPEIKINKIYTSNVPTFEQAKEKYPQETEWENFQEFTALNLENVEWLKESDEINDIIGLKMKVLWAYSDWIYENCNNLLNNGSLIFKLYGKEQSMIFCSDTQNPKVEEQVTKKHKSDLKSDYMQVGHHGNNNFSQNFYKLVSPKKAFFAAPKVLIDNPDNISWFTAGQVNGWLEEMGTETYCHETAPNVFELK